MKDHLLFAEWLLCWHAANYAVMSDPVRGDQTHSEAATSAAANGRAWFIQVALRSIAAGVAVIFAGHFDRRAIFTGAIVLTGSILIPVARRRFVPVRVLGEFELLANAGIAVLLWFMSHGLPGRNLPVETATGANRLAAICLCAALFVYAVRGGTYLVRGILEKAGGIPRPAIVSSEGYTHGRFIGQVERAIVFLIVIAGNLAALAFFFAAKGLIRSRELEERDRVDYLLLGSLSSFLVALAAGLVAQRILPFLWQ
ncbi:MAG TPA: hypothetical protein VHE33_16295 [Acidobacteriaceae bacterium]|nr:hypothetical protein [Acidobacteriaceae bacterium]